MTSMRRAFPHLSTRAGLACLVWGAIAQHVVVAESTEKSTADPPTVTLVGRVVDADATPLDVFMLTVYRSGRVPQVHWFEQADGRLEVDLAIGAMGIALDASRFARWFDVVRFNSAGHHDVGTVYLHGGRIVITGRVTDALIGSPVAGARIWYAPSELEVLNIDVGEEYPIGWWATTDEDGKFALYRLPKHGVRLEVSSVRHIAQAVGLPPGKDHLDIELVGGAMIEGTLSLANGTPVEGTATLRLDSRWWRALERQIDADGEFRFEALPAGS